MKVALLIAAGLTASVTGAVIDERQIGGRPTRTGGGGARPTTTRPGGGSGGDVSKCGLDAFVGHTAEASMFCSSILAGGTATVTATVIATATTTKSTTVVTTLRPTSTPAPPVSSTIIPPSSTVPGPTSSSPAPSSTPGCGIVGYAGSTAAYYFDSSGTKNTWAACDAACKADAKCQSFGYGEANCMLFDVKAAGNTNINPMSPYTFYDVECPEELPVRKEKRQVNISLNLPGGSPALSSACSCLITSAPGATTTTVKTTATSQVTKTATVTKTVTGL